MKQFFKAFILLICICANLQAQSSPLTCNLGFAFEISRNPNWGHNEPVVVDITPGSPAEKAGLQINDVILEVNGNGTYLKPYQSVMSWFALSETEINISVRNFTSSFKNMVFAKDCRHPNAIREDQLAPVFAFFSLEDVQDRRFVIPVKTTINPDAVFFGYRTFGFAPSDDATRQIDERINAIFIRSLAKIGLKYSAEDPDFIIQTFYSYEKNPMYKPDSETYGTYQPVWRFDMRNRRMVRIPVYDPAEGVRVSDIMYNLEFGYRFYDRKFLEPGTPVLIWESEVQERLSANYELLDYLEMNLPLLLCKFPYPGNLTQATFDIRHLKYNYTGIGFDMNDLKTVISVDAESPAALAGIQPGDVVTNIQNHRFNHATSQPLTESYRRFIAETMPLRDKNTRYTDSNGFKDCMFWDIARYGDIAKAVGDTRRYKSAFAYLFNFNQYIDWATPRVLDIGISRGTEKMQFQIVPQITINSQIFAY